MGDHALERSDDVALSSVDLEAKYSEGDRLFEARLDTGRGRDHPVGSANDTGHGHGHDLQDSLEFVHDGATTSQRGGSCCVTPKLLVTWKSIVDSPRNRHARAGKLKEHHRAHSWTELFYDLIFVAVLVKLSVLLKSGHGSAGSIAIAFVLWMSIYNCWDAFTMFHNRFEITDEGHNFIRFCHMFGVVMIACSIGGTVDETFQKMYFVATGVIISRLMLAFLYISILRNKRNTFKDCEGKSTIALLIVQNLIICMLCWPLLTLFQDTLMGVYIMSLRGNGTMANQTSSSNIHTMFKITSTKQITSSFASTISSATYSVAGLVHSGGNYSSYHDAAEDNRHIFALIMWGFSTLLEPFNAFFCALCNKNDDRMTCLIPCLWKKKTDCGKSIWGKHNQRALPIDVDHVCQRFAEFTMLVLGESIISLLLTSPKDQYTSAEQQLYHFMVLFFGFHITWMFKLYYFAVQPSHPTAHHAMNVSALKAIFWQYTHPILYFTLLLVGSSIKMIIYSINDSHLHLSEAKMLSFSLFGSLVLMSLQRMVHQEKMSNGSWLKRVFCAHSGFLWILRSFFICIMLVLPFIADALHWVPVKFIGCTWLLVCILRTVDHISPETTSIGCLKQTKESLKITLKEVTLEVSTIGKGLHELAVETKHDIVVAPRSIGNALRLALPTSSSAAHTSQHHNVPTNGNLSDENDEAGEHRQQQPML